MPRVICCAGCAKRIYHNPASSRPAGEARCRACWKAEREHGTVTMYRKGGCRCQACKAAQAAHISTYYAARRDAGNPIPKNRGERRRYHLTEADRIAIYERDCWTCQLCREPVEKDEHFNHPLAPTLDHIEPQSLALIPDHSPANLRLAHRICNARRGARFDVA